MAKHCLEDVERDFWKNVSEGDIIVAGENFGCGSSREMAPLALIGCGIKCVIAKSFSRIFYRNAVNNGLMLFESKKLQNKIKNYDLVAVDYERCEIWKDNECIEIFATERGIAEDIVNSGGLICYLKKNKLM